MQNQIYREVVMRDEVIVFFSSQFTQYLPVIYRNQISEFYKYLSMLKLSILKIDTQSYHSSTCNISKISWSGIPLFDIYLLNKYQTGTKVFCVVFQIPKSILPEWRRTHSRFRNICKDIERNGRHNDDTLRGKK